MKTILGSTDNEFSALVLEAAELSLVDEERVDRALRAMPRASRATVARTAPPLVAMLRILYAAVRENGLTDGRPVVFAIGPLPCADGSAQIRVDLCSVPAGESARSYAQLLATGMPTVLAVGFEHMTGSGARIHASGRSTPGIVSGLVASAFMRDESDGDDGDALSVESAWILADGESAIEPCIPIAMAVPADA